MRVFTFLLILWMSGCNATKDKTVSNSELSEMANLTCDIRNDISDFNVYCEDGKVIYENESDQDIYMFSADKELIRRIRWVPSVIEEPTLKAGESMAFDFPERWVEFGGASIHCWNAVIDSKGMKQPGPVSGASLTFVEPEEEQ